MVVEVVEVVVSVDTGSLEVGAGVSVTSGVVSDIVELDVSGAWCG